MRMMTMTIKMVLVMVVKVVRMLMKKEVGIMQHD